MVPKCPACGKNDAIKDDYWGILPCKSCQDRQANLNKPKAQTEFTSDSIKEQRKIYAKDIEADHRSGQLNKAWLDIHGVKAAKRRGYTDKEIKEAKYVYAGDDPNTHYYKKGN